MGITAISVSIVCVVITVIMYEALQVQSNSLDTRLTDESQNLERLATNLTRSVDEARAIQKEQSEKIRQLSDEVSLLKQNLTKSEADTAVLRSMVVALANKLPPSNLSNNSGDSYNPRIAAQGSNVYTTWYDNTQGFNDILFRASHDNGISFDKIFTLNDNVGDSFNPDLAVSGNNVYSVWSGLVGNSNVTGLAPPTLIYFRMSEDSGSSFKPMIALTNSSTSSSAPTISLSGNGEGNSVHVSWTASRPPDGNFQIYYSGSDDNGRTFSSPLMLGDGHDQQISSFGSNVYVVWEGGYGNLLFSHSSNGGKTFSTPFDLTMNKYGFEGQERISVSPASGHVYVTWMDTTADSGARIMFRRSIDGGGTFQSAISISNSFVGSAEPQLVALNNLVSIVWRTQLLILQTQPILRGFKISLSGQAQTMGNHSKMLSI